MPRPCAGHQHGRSGRLCHGAPPRRGVCDQHQRAGRCLDLIAGDCERGMAVDHQVELLVLGKGFGVVADQGAADLIGAVGIDAEGTDAEMVADGDPAVPGRNPVERCHCEITHGAFLVRTDFCNLPSPAQSATGGCRPARARGRAGRARSCRGSCPAARLPRPRSAAPPPSAGTPTTARWATRRRSRAR